ncbi:MAG: hypothetical protein K8I03_12265 [Ignavibacteria bacterium]|nr:hypothetical protein [Ignavibacteria bacterium]
MKRNSDLFDLIKSMDKNEKRYFRLSSEVLSGSKNYIELFDAIECQKTYDENAIKSKYKARKFVKQFAYTKNYLYGLIINSMASYRKNSSIDYRLHTMIMQCKILFSKALFGQYFRSIEAAKKLALKYERFGYYLQVLDMEKIIIRKQEIQTLKSAQIYEEAISALEKFRNIFDYSKVSSRLMNIYRTSGSRRSEKQEEFLDSILSEPIMKNVDEAKSERGKEVYYRLMGMISDIKTDYKKAVSETEKRLQIVNSTPEPFEDFIINYAGDALYSLFEASMKLNRHSEAEEYLRQIEENASFDKGSHADFRITSLFARFSILMKKGDYHKAGRLISELESTLKRYENKLLLDTEISILFGIVKCRLLEKKYSAALKAANNLVLHPLLYVRADYESYLRVIILIIHFEMKNYSLLKYLIISSYRFLYKREKLYKLESYILEFIRKLPEVKTDDDLNFMFIKFRKRIEVLKEDKYEKNAFEYFDFLDWVESKLGVTA